MIKISIGIIGALIIIACGCQQPEPKTQPKPGYVYEVDERGRLIEMGPVEHYYTRP